jgi:tellurite methyltransferase
MNLQAKWDARYRELEIGAARPARALSEHLHLLPTAGRALDVACGLGGNALLLAGLGLDVTAYDVSAVAVNKLNTYAQGQQLKLRAELRDVERAPPPAGAFDVVTVSYFLERSLTAALIDALRSGGLLFYQTFTLERVDDTGPSNPAFRLATNELLRLFAPLRILLYREEGLVGDLSRGLRNEAMLIGRKEVG